jgi:hypothetical protein
MKKTIILILISLSSFAQVQIGTFTDNNYPVYLIGYIVQSTADGNFMMFRGGNFQDNSLVKTDVPKLGKWLGNNTDWQGMVQPDVDKLPAIIGWEVCYCYDVVWNVTGHGLCKDNIDYDAYRSDPNLRLFKSYKAANKEILTKPNTNPILVTASNWNIGLVGYNYGSDYWALLSEREAISGESVFDFRGQPDYNYPQIRATKFNGEQEYGQWVPIHLPSHSTTAAEVGGQERIISMISIEMFDSSGALVWKLYDTKGGFHGKFGGDLRGNNHPDNCQRWIKRDIYTVKIKNISQDDRVVQGFEWSNSEVLIYEKIYKGEEKTFTLDMRNLKNGWNAWKLNCNYY